MIHLCHGKQKLQLLLAMAIGIGPQFPLARSDELLNIHVALRNGMIPMESQEDRVIRNISPTGLFSIKYLECIES